MTLVYGQIHNITETMTTTVVTVVEQHRNPEKINVLSHEVVLINLPHLYEENFNRETIHSLQHYLCIYKSNYSITFYHHSINSFI